MLIACLTEAKRTEARAPERSIAALGPHTKIPAGRYLCAKKVAVPDVELPRDPREQEIYSLPRQKYSYICPNHLWWEAIKNNSANTSSVK
jgi:hypothetical protein